MVTNTNMALKVKFNNKNGYVKIMNVSYVRGSMSAMSGQDPNAKVFTSVIEYVILDNDDKDIGLSRGTLNLPYDLTSVDNVFENAYNELKKLKDFKEAKDI